MDFADQYYEVPMLESFVAETPAGEVLVRCESRDFEWGNPSWLVCYYRKDGKRLNRAACFGSNPLRDRAIGLRVAADRLRQLQQQEVA